MSSERGARGTPRLIRLGIDIVAFSHRVERKILSCGKAAANGQLQDAAASALANAGEAWDEPRPKEKRRFLRYAVRSAGECQRLIEAAARIGVISAADFAEGLRLLLAFKLDALRLIRWCERQTTP